MIGERAYNWYSHMASWYSDDTEKTELHWLAESDTGELHPSTPNLSRGGGGRVEPLTKEAKNKGSFRIKVARGKRVKHTPCIHKVPPVQTPCQSPHCGSIISIGFFGYLVNGVISIAIWSLCFA